MTPKMLRTRAPDPVEMVITYFLDMPGDVGDERLSGQPLPYTLVSMIANPAGEDPNLTLRCTIQLDTFHTRKTACSDAAWDNHHHMLALGPPGGVQQPVAISGGRTVYAGKVFCSLLPHEEFYSNSTVRFTARYRLDTRYI